VLGRVDKEKGDAEASPSQEGQDQSKLSHSEEKSRTCTGLPCRAASRVIALSMNSSRSLWIRMILDIPGFVKNQIFCRELPGNEIN